ncbi:MAG TPA: DUF1015 family protein [Gammaproteobacteria bacterium]|nr:DUF1015 family protein [Gammaproteobacteria bacterium]
MSDLVKPFAALRPRRGYAGEVIAPPYDVVSTDEARALANGRPWSFLHVSRPEIDLPRATDPHAEAVYQRGTENLERLRKSEILTREPIPSFYVYRMRMGRHEQTGFACVASVRAYEKNIIRKHELTRPDKENDRVRNIEALNAQTGPVLMAYRSDEALRDLLREGTRQLPLFEVEGPNEVTHTVWQVGSAAFVERLTAAVNALGALYIADGHHRSAAAARVAEARRRLAGGASRESASYEYFLSVAFPHDEMRIFDYNRVVSDLGGLTPAAFLERLGEIFRVEPAAGRAKPVRAATFGMYLTGQWYTLALPVDAIPDDPVASLDVSLLQDLVIGPVLGIENPRTDQRIDFVGGVRGLEELERRVDGGAAIAFAMYPTSMEQLMTVADAAKLMPPKSTWFEPKLADGLLSHVLD